MAWLELGLELVEALTIIVLRATFVVAVVNVFISRINARGRVGAGGLLGGGEDPRLEPRQGERSANREAS